MKFLLITTLLLLALVARAAGFGDFFEFFGGEHDHGDDDGSDHHHHGHAHQESQSKDSPEKCAGFFCAETSKCVSAPINCPCPSPLDRKCRTKGSSADEDWYVCLRSDKKCKEFGLKQFEA